MSNSYLHLSQGRTFPNPSTELGWKLRYSPESITREDQMVLASMVSAYSYLTLEISQKQRNEVCQSIKEEVSKYE